jgi:AraC family transcriptional regulator
MASLAKPREQISGIVGGKIVPATDTPLLTSASTPWFGFLLEKHNAGDRQDILWGWHRAHVGLITKGQIGFSVRNFSGNREHVARAGNVSIFPSGFDETLFSISESKFEAIVVELDPALLEALLGDHMAASTSTLVPQIAIHDRYVALLLRAMAAEVAQGCPAGALYGHALSLALATYLARTFSVKRRIERKRPLWVAGAKSWGTLS